MQPTLPYSVLETLADDLACNPDDFLRDSNTVVQYELRPRRRRFPANQTIVHLITVGHGAVISADADHYAWAQETIAPIPADELLTGNGLAHLLLRLHPEGRAVNGPVLSYLCTNPQAPPAPPGICVKVLENEQISSLYRYKGLGMALSYCTQGDRPDTLAVAAWEGDELAAVAGCSADSDLLWQIGIDVAPAYRKHGLGTALVAQLTHLALEKGKIPYYTTGLHNLASQRLATTAGYHPAWVSIYTR